MVQQFRVASRAKAKVRVKGALAQITTTPNRGESKSGSDTNGATVWRRVASKSESQSDPMGHGSSGASYLKHQATRMDKISFINRTESSIR